jgi:Tol biopolymer transport system component
MKKILVILSMGLIIIINVSCNESTPTESGYQLPVPPPMTDVIPYGVLGHGKIAFERIGPTENNYSGVYVINIDAQTSSVVGSGVFDGVTISPLGEKIAYSTSSSINTYYDINVMNTNGTNIEKISEIVGQEFYPSWTPDNQKILFIANEFEEFKTVAYIQSPTPNSPDRTAIKTFAYASGPNSRLSVSNNNRLVFSLMGKGIYVMNIDGTNVEELISGTNYYSPVWSPNGSQIAFLTVDTDSTGHYSSMDVKLMNSDGSNPESVVQLSAHGYGEWAGENNNTICWSPDGTKLLFNKHDGDLESHIYIINVDGSSLTQVTFAEGVTDRSLSWGN